MAHTRETPPGPPPQDDESRQRGRGGGGNGWVYLLLGFILLGVLTAGVVWLIGDGDVADDGAEPAAVGVTIEDLLDDPEAYQGQAVEVVGEVRAQLMDQLFVILPEGEAGGDVDGTGILVFVEQGIDVEDGALLRVTGVVEHAGPDLLIADLDGEIPSEFTDFYRPSQVEAPSEEEIDLTVIRATAVDSAG